MSQKLDLFELPPGFRGRSSFCCQLWWVIQACLFSTSPQFMYWWRRFLLRIFGAKIGRGVIIRPSVKITFPWKLEIGNNSWIGDNVDLYSLNKITIGNNVVVSQRSYICTGGHDLASVSFDIFSKPIVISDGVWIATDVFVAPGVNIGSNAVVGARSSVFSNLEPDYIYYGTPAKAIKKRIFYMS